MSVDWKRCILRRNGDDTPMITLEEIFQSIGIGVSVPIAIVIFMSIIFKVWNLINSLRR